MFVYFLICIGKVTPPFIDVRPFHTTVFYFPFVRAVVQLLCRIGICCIILYQSFIGKVAMTFCLILSYQFRCELHTTMENLTQPDC